jgi:accessory gene regulator protein AgrB
MNEMDDRIKKRITLIALLIALIHLICPTLAIDGITLTLLLIALIPWLSPVFKSLQFPGGWKIEYQEIKDKMETI